MKIGTTTIKVEGIEVYGFHGVLEHEKHIGTTFLVDVTLEYDAEGAMKYDDIALALNYARITEIVKGVMEKPAALIEHKTYCIIEALCEAFPMALRGTVAVTKLNPPVGVKTAGATFTASF